MVPLNSSFSLNLTKLTKPIKLIKPKLMKKNLRQRYARKHKHVLSEY